MIKKSEGSGEYIYIGLHWNIRWIKGKIHEKIKHETSGKIHLPVNPQLLLSECFQREFTGNP